jgi:hypothetical protein
MLLYHNFRKAAKGQGKYIPDRNELQVRKGRRLYRFICGHCEIRIVSTAHTEVVLPVAPDVTVRELRRCFAELTGAPNGMILGTETLTDYS